MLMFVSNGQPKNDDNSNTPLSLSLSLSFHSYPRRILTILTFSMFLRVLAFTNY